MKSHRLISYVSLFLYVTEISTVLAVKGSQAKKK